MVIRGPQTIQIIMKILRIIPATRTISATKIIIRGMATTQDTTTIHTRITQDTRTIILVMVTIMKDMITMHITTILDMKIILGMLIIKEIQPTMRIITSMDHSPIVKHYQIRAISKMNHNYDKLIPKYSHYYHHINIII